ncbi:MAG: hypothetical protein MJA29_07290, partial [Candidatus Omnitrophica bacterium]|nr:hypothetical protein [Candidatus Omnitrophota bacterium]
NVDVGNNLYVRSGINVGPGGIKSDGPLTITGEGTAPSSSLEIRSAGAGNDFYLNIANGKLLMKSADNTCSACGPYNNNTWACVSVTCP